MYIFKPLSKKRKIELMEQFRPFFKEEVSVIVESTYDYLSDCYETYLKIKFEGVYFKMYLPSWENPNIGPEDLVRRLITKKICFLTYDINGAKLIKILKNSLSFDIDEYWKGEKNENIT